MKTYTQYEDAAKALKADAFITPALVLDIDAQAFQEIYNYLENDHESQVDSNYINTPGYTVVNDLAFFANTTGEDPEALREAVDGISFVTFQPKQ